MLALGCDKNYATYNFEGRIGNELIKFTDSSIGPHNELQVFSRENKLITYIDEFPYGSVEKILIQII